MSLNLFLFFWFSQIFCVFVMAMLRDACGTVMPIASESKENPKILMAASDMHRDARTYNGWSAGGGGGSGGGGGVGNYAYNRPQERSRCISCLYAAMVGGGGGREAVGGYPDRDR